MSVILYFPNPFIARPAPPGFEQWQKNAKQNGNKITCNILRYIKDKKCHYRKWIANRQSRGQNLGKPNPNTRTTLPIYNSKINPKNPHGNKKTPTQTHHIKQQYLHAHFDQKYRQTTPQQPTSLLHIGIRKEERERRKEGVKGK